MPTRSRHLGNSTLLTSQKNDVFRKINSAGLNPEDFDLRELPTEHDNVVSTLFYKSSDALFVFNTEFGGFNAIRTPGKEHRTDTKNCNNWDGILNYFVEWTSILKREISTPNLWEIFKTTGINFTLEPSTTEPNSNFTPEEQLALTTQLREIETYIQTTYSPTAVQLDTINHKFDLLISEVGKQGRDTWKYMAIGIIFTVIANLSITPQEGQILWHYITGTLSEVLTNIRLAIT